MIAVARDASIKDQAPATARLVSLNRARRGAYNDIDSVNISGGLVVLQFELKLKTLAADGPRRR